MHAIVYQLVTMNPCVVLGDLSMNLPSTFGVDEKIYGFFEDMQYEKIVSIATKTRLQLDKQVTMNMIFSL